MAVLWKLGVLLLLALAFNFAHAADSEIVEADRTFWNKLAKIVDTGSEDANVGGADDNIGAPAGGEGAVLVSGNDQGVSESAGMTGAGNQGNTRNLGDIVLDKVILPKRVLDAFEENAKDQDIAGPVNKICDLQMDRGPCRGYFRKFYFDKFTGECAMFVFGGCKGNGNRFNTMEECKKTCSSFPIPEVTETPRQTDVCQLPKVSGPCTGPFRQYYYYPYTSKCELVFGGCLSGGNRFDSLEKCENLCVPMPDRSEMKSTLPPGYSGAVTDGGQVVDVSVIIEPTNPNCSLPKEAGLCYGYFLSYFYNIATTECESFVYGGCQGNANRFSSLKECEQACVSKAETDVVDIVVSPVNESKDGDKVEEINKEVLCAPPVSDIDGPVPCLRSFVKYYYNSTTDKCELVYGACNGYGDLFDNQGDCESVCLSASTVPSPQAVTLPTKDICKLHKDTGPCEAAIRKFHFDTETGMCQEFFYGGCAGNENRFDSIFQCLETCGADSSKDEGLQPTQNDDACELERDSGPCYAAFKMFYFNKSANKCEPFLYGGCQGNQNRFLSLGQCQRRCLQTTEKPLETSTSPVIKDICSLKLDRGPCRASHTKFFFNSETKKCEEFVYGGCVGNDNRFDSMKDCEDKCSTESSATTLLMPVDVCSLSPESGPCKAAFTYYYYNPSSRKCEAFLYGGCKGNGNRFATIGMCEMICAMSDVDEGTVAPVTPSMPSSEPDGKNVNITSVVLPVDICLLDVDIGPCRAAFRNFFFNSQTGKCEEFLYGGCKGNGNRFLTVGMCEMICMPEERSAEVPEKPTESAMTTTVTPAKPNACFLGQDSGPCRGAIKSFFFNDKSGSCEEFSYGGCKGNGNRFATVEMCQTICMPEDQSTKEPQQSTKSVMATTSTLVTTNTCFLGPDTGPCKGAFLRYYFNPASNKCEEFLYGGCRGNGNRFNTIEMCEMICVITLDNDDDDNNQNTTVRPPAKPTDEEPSAQPTDQSTESPDAEPAHSSTASTDTEPDAEPADMSSESPDVEPKDLSTELPDAEPSAEPTDESTKSPGAEPSAVPSEQPTESPDAEPTDPPTESPDAEPTDQSTESPDTVTSPAEQSEQPEITATPLPVDRCSLRKDHGPCFGLFKQYFFDKSSGRCRKFMYGGCKGNDNRFDTSAECEKACVPAPAADAMMRAKTASSPTTRDVCLLPRRAGPCYETSTRYFYNKESGKCEEFNFGGCLGNENRFEMLEQCEERCVIKPTAPPCVMSSACPVCMQEVPKRIFPVFCLASNAYKSTVRKVSTESWPLKIQADLRPAEKVPLGFFTKWVLPDECECPILEKVGNKVVLLVGSNAELLRVPDSRTRTLIYLNNDVTVLPLTIDLERTIFKSHKTNECDQSSNSRK